MSGALSYSEIASRIPRSGGEYHFLSRIYHPFLGFLAGWTSVFIGFAAPTALAAMALAGYLHAVFKFIPIAVAACAAIISLSLIHSFQIKLGGQFQRWVTLIKIFLLLLFISAGLIFGHPAGISVIPVKTDFQQLLSPAFAISLIFVSYSFSGWNASVYIINEIKDPKKNIPLSLVAGTSLVTILYILLNFIFLYTTPVEELNGQMEIGFISATHIFGVEGGKILAITIVLLLISSVSALIWIGSRVSMVMGEDYRLLKFLGKTNRYGVPVSAIWIQAVISIIMILTSTFESVLVYTGFTLNIFTLLSVIGVFVLRFRSTNEDNAFRSPGYPVVPFLFILASLWTMVYLIRDRTVESLLGILSILSGGIFYFLEKTLTRRRDKI